MITMALERHLESKEGRRHNGVQGGEWTPDHLHCCSGDCLGSFLIGYHTTSVPHKVPSIDRRTPAGQSAACSILGPSVNKWAAVLSSLRQLCL